MAKSEANFGALLTTGILAFDRGMIAASTAREKNEARRNAFRRTLEVELEHFGLELLDLTIGRAQGNVPFWNVACRDGHAQLRTMRVELPLGTDPFGSVSHTLLVENAQKAA